MRELPKLKRLVSTEGLLRDKHMLIGGVAPGGQCTLLVGWTVLTLVMERAR